MARLEYMELRLRNWARWRLVTKRGGLGYAHVDITQPIVDGGGYDTPLPISIDDEEARTTDEAISALVSELRRTVEVYYLDAGSLECKLRLLCVGKATLYERLGRADYVMSVWFSERHAKVKEQRRLNDQSQHKKSFPN